MISSNFKSNRAITMVRLGMIRLCSSANAPTNLVPIFLSENHKIVTKRSRHFLDALKIQVQGGNAGSGLPAYGGRGGNGGHVIFKCDSKIESLQQLKTHIVELRIKHKNLQAENGTDSAKYKLVGDRGRDLVINCPAGCELKNSYGTHIGELDRQHSQIKIQLGGEGGRKENNYIGRLGAKMNVTIDLKLISDIGLVGYPNAGKSTLLKSLTRAKPEIANFPFTTITPNIGIVKYNDNRKISIADLPGLIKGSHQDIGLGHKFVKHIVRTKMLLFVIAAQRLFTVERKEGYSPIEILLTLIKEIELYDPRILQKLSVLVFSKCDLPNAEQTYQSFRDQLELVQESDFSDINLTEDYIPKKVIDFDFILPVSSKTSWNIVELQKMLREQIDYHFEAQLIKSGEIQTFEESVKKPSNKRNKVDLVIT